MNKQIESHLKEACQLTGAIWVVLAGCEEGRWLVSATYHRPRIKRLALNKLLQQDAIVGLLESALNKENVRAFPLPKGLNHLGERLYVFGLREIGQVIIVSANQQSSSARQIWQLIARMLVAVVSSANQYKRLQDTIRELRIAQVESHERLSAQQKAESRLVQAAKLVAVGEMAAGIAHELNNPLTTVTGFTELILDETPPDAAFRADVEMVLHEALRARGVVRRLLDFARQGEQTRSKADLNEILDDVIALTTHFIHTSGVELNVAFAKDLPWVSVDSNQMKQVFLNLIHNALQAMPSGGTLQVMSETKVKQDQEWAVVEIRDSGIGIDPGDMDRIFEPFFTTKGNRGGTGLGLSVTYGIVTDHGGTIEVTSRLGEGSSFRVWLPV